MSKVVALASDHGGFELKNLLVEKLKKTVTTFWIWERIRKIPSIIRTLPR